jgi:hypothetical protein
LELIMGDFETTISNYIKNNGDFIHTGTDVGSYTYMYSCTLVHEHQKTKNSSQSTPYGM